MKKLLALAVLASTSMSYAADRDIFDIMYLPNAGTSYGFSQAERLQGEAEFVGVGDVEVEGYRFVQTVGHAFTNSLSVQGSLNYMAIEADLEGETSETTGPSDLLLEGRYRLSDAALRYDALVGVLTGPGDAETEDDGDSNNYQGGTSAYIGAQVGQKMPSFQWAGLAKLQHNFPQSVESSGVAFKNDAHNELQLRGDILNRFAESSFLRTFAQVDFVESYEDDASDSNASSTMYSVGTEYQHMMSKDLLARVGVDYIMTNSDTGNVEDNKSWVLRLGANYQF